MTTVKKTSGDYLVDTPNMTITGNLYVLGNSSIISSQTLEVADNMIVVNSGELGDGVTLRYAGTKVDRGLQPNTSVVWDEVDNAWKIYFGPVEPSNPNWQYILTSEVQFGGLTAVFDDKTPELGGNLNVLNQTIYSSNGNTIVSLESATSGHSGVFVNNDKKSIKQELITKNRSLVYSLIL